MTDADDHHRLPTADSRDSEWSRLRLTVNCSILFTDRPLLERPAAATAAGFRAIEFWWPFPESVPADAAVERFVRAVDDAGVHLSGINFAGGSLADGDRGLVSWIGRSSEFRDNVDVVAGLGKRLGIEVFNALYGNRIEGSSPRAQDELATQNLRFAASRVPGVVVVEPISGIARYPLRTAADALDVIDTVDADNLGLLADLYHLTVNGDDVDAVLRGNAGRIAHVQIADAPGRNEPGTGTAPLSRYLSILREAGYRGRVGLEYNASAPDPFGWLPMSDRAPHAER
jgi:hydroxypyruvate isomerase